MIKKHGFIIAIIVLSLLTHFIFFGDPNSVVFDEVHFGGFVSRYFQHEYFFDIHPPAGKLLIYGAGLLAGFEPEQDFAHIGNEFSNTEFLSLRLLPTIAGVLLPIIMFFLARRLGLSKLGTFVAGMLIILENALLVQSKFMLLDMFLLSFGFGALLSYFTYRQTQRKWQIVLAFVLASLALSVKWTGVTFLGIIGLIEIYDIIRSRYYMRFLHLAGYTLVAFLVYFSLFAIHFSILTKSGPGDGFMTPEFRKTLIGSADYDRTDIEPLGPIGKFLEINKQMHLSNSGLKATHPYSTKPGTDNVYEWYTWPLMQRPIYYWSGPSEVIDKGPIEGGIRQQGRIYLLGNPIIWWSSAFAIVFLILSFLYDLPQVIKKQRKLDKLGIFLVFAFLVNFIPFAFIDRALFLYHYFPALVISTLGLAYILEMLPNKKFVVTVFLGISVIIFLYFAPLTYGTVLEEAQYNERVWFDKGWR